VDEGEPSGTKQSSKTSSQVSLPRIWKTHVRLMAFSNSHFQLTPILSSFW